MATIRLRGLLAAVENFKGAYMPKAGFFFVPLTKHVRAQLGMGIFGFS